jgi:chorismate-pyruvate lyase
MNATMTDPQRIIARMQSADAIQHNTDPVLRPWLGLTESMTAAVAHHCRGQALVTLLGEGLAVTNTWEQQCLNVNEDTDDIYVRHISLSVAGIPRLIARSLTPARSSVVDLMRGLGERPLAELLFTDPMWRRTADAVNLRTVDGLSGRGILWCHQKHQQQLLVEEFFLPALLQHSTD